MREHIVIVEDDPVVSVELNECLVDEGYRVSVFDSAEAMWRALDKTDADLFLLDLTLPGEGGLSIARQLRRKSEVGIIMVTGKTAEVDRVVGLELGADDYITKPFSPRELIARVGSVLRRTKGSSYNAVQGGPAGDSPRLLSFEGWQLDVGAHELTSPKAEDVALTTAEFQLLRALAESPNRVYSRQQLLDRIHESNWFGYDRGIDGLVSRLRKKLGRRSNNSEFIKTVRGAGYMFVASVSVDRN